MKRPLLLIGTMVLGLAGAVVFAWVPTGSVRGRTGVQNPSLGRAMEAGPQERASGGEDVPWAQPPTDIEWTGFDKSEMSEQVARIAGPMLAQLETMERDPVMAANPELMRRIHEEREKILVAAKGVGK